MQKGKLNNLVALTITIALAWAAAFAQSTRNLVTNDDNPDGNTVTFYTLDLLGGLTQSAVVPTGATGKGAGRFSQHRVAVYKGSQVCVYVTNNGFGSSNITGLVAATHEVVGPFSGSSDDTLNISLTLSGTKLYAGFGSGNIATFQVGDGCSLEFLGDVQATGSPNGMKAMGNILVVTYQDFGYYESYDISGTLPSFNHDRQQSNGFKAFGFSPAGVDISKDGHWAVFGDEAGRSAVEVSDISSGKVTPTRLYLLGVGKNSNNVTLSPDQKFLYVSNNFSAQVSALFFDTATGVPSAGCNATLRGAPQFVGEVATAPSKDSSGFIYVAEYDKGIGTLRVQASNGACSLVEADNSPTPDPQSSSLLSLETYLVQ